MGGCIVHEMAQLPPHPRPLPTARKSSREEGSGEAVLTSQNQQQAMRAMLAPMRFRGDERRLVQWPYKRRFIAL